MNEREALKLALEALEVCQQSNYGRDWVWPDTAHPTAMANVKEAIIAIREALAQPEEEPLHPVHIGVDVTREGTAVTAFYRKPDAVMEMFYSQFHPLAQPEPVIDKSAAVRIATSLGWEPKRKPLTEPELHAINPTWPAPGQEWGYEEVLAFARAIEAAHGIKE